MPLGIKTVPTPEVTSWELKEQRCGIHLWENDSGERSRAIMAVLFSVVLCIKIKNSNFLTKYLRINNFSTLLAHMSATCSKGAFRVTGCPSSVVRRQQFF